MHQLPLNSSVWTERMEYNIAHCQRKPILTIITYETQQK
jgi:hypothetical protein